MQKNSSGNTLKIASYLLLFSRFLFEIDDNLHAGFAMSVDKLVGIIVFLEGETVAYEWLEVDDALAT